MRPVKTGTPRPHVKTSRVGKQTLTHRVCQDPVQIQIGSGEITTNKNIVYLGFGFDLVFSSSASGGFNHCVRCCFKV